MLLVDAASLHDFCSEILGLSNMFSTTVSVIIAVGFISFVSGIVLERGKSAYEVAFKCSKVGWDADVSALHSGDGSKSDNEIIEDACLYLREFARCIIETNPDDYALPIPNIVHFLVAYEWQHMVIAKKAGLCKDMPIDDLKKITMESGIMVKENLPNNTRDSYEECAGDAMRKCMIRAESLMKQGISQDFLSAITDYITCFEEAGYICDAPMLQHFIAIMKAYKKHLEENKGKYGKMLNQMHQ